MSSHWWKNIFSNFFIMMMNMRNLRNAHSLPFSSKCSNQFFLHCGQISFLVFLFFKTLLYWVWNELIHNNFLFFFAYFLINIHKQNAFSRFISKISWLLDILVVALLFQVFSSKYPERSIWFEFWSPTKIDFMRLFNLVFEIGMRNFYCNL